MNDRQPENIYCPNCSHFLREQDNYCAHCGQKNTTHRLSIGRFILISIQQIFNFDTRTYHTLKDMWVPGLITDRFNQGHRRFYVPPLQFYLLISFLFFLEVNFITQQDAEKVNQELNTVIQSDSIADTGRINMVGKSLLTVKEIKALLKKGEVTSADLDSVFKAKDLKVNWVEMRVALFGVALMAGQINYVDLYHSMMENTSRVMFLLMPLLALLLKLFFAGNRMYYTEHLVFSLHLHSFAFIWMGILLALNYGIGTRYMQLVVIFGILVYLTLAVHRVYGRSWGGTILRTSLISGLYGLILMLGLTLATLGSIIK